MIENTINDDKTIADVGKDITLAGRRWAWAWRFGKRKKWYNMTVNLSARDS